MIINHPMKTWVFHRFFPTSFDGSLFDFFQEYIVHIDPVTGAGAELSDSPGYSIGDV